MSRPVASPMRLARFALTAIVVVMLGGCGDTRTRTEPLPAGANVVALGDSLTYGTGAAASTSYPSVLSQMTGWQVVNAGIPGETAHEGCARLPELIDEHRPRLVVVLLGGNDFLRRLPADGVRNALRACIDTARSRATAIVLVPVPQLGLGRLRSAELYTELGRERSVPVIDAGLGDLLANASMRADRVHLNAEGYRALAQRLVDGLRAEGFVPR